MSSKKRTKTWSLSIVSKKNSSKTLSIRTDNMAEEDLFSYSFLLFTLLCRRKTFLHFLYPEFFFSRWHSDVLFGYSVTSFRILYTSRWKLCVWLTITQTNKKKNIEKNKNKSKNVLFYIERRNSVRKVFFFFCFCF